jgi:type II restriction enzyme
MKEKDALDRIIRKSRVHFYKPIQIAEILFHDRTRRDIDLADPESYRNPSKRWRDRVSLRLIGRVCTSSQKFQDNIFEQNAMPPNMLVRLGKHNREGSGVVEAYVYRALANKLSTLAAVKQYVSVSSSETFSLEKKTMTLT